MFSIPYSARHRIQEYVAQYCAEQDLDIYAMANKVNGLLVQLGILNLPLDGVTSSQAMFSVLNSFPFTEKQLLEHETCPEGILDDSKNKSIYFLGHSDELVRQYSNPHVDRLLHGGAFHSVAARLPPSRVPEHIRGMYGADTNILYKDTMLLYISDWYIHHWLLCVRETSRDRLPDEGGADGRYRGAELAVRDPARPGVGSYYIVSCYHVNIANVLL